MAINSVDMSKALKNEAYAAQVIRSGKCSGSERSQLAAQWGSDKITKWESVDSTQYEITDDEKQAARSKGDEKVNNATGGFDGKSDGTRSAVGTAATGAATGAAAVSSAATAAAVFATTEAEASNAPKGFASGWVAAICGAALLAISIMIKAMNPNHDQAQACDDLKDTMTESQNELQEHQNNLSDTTNDLSDKTDELIKTGDEANETTETKQEEYEKLKARYQELVAKQEAAKSGGEPLTDAEKAEFQKLASSLGTAFEDLQNVKTEGDETIEAAKEEAEAAQEVYDDAAVKMEEVHEITDFQAEFDEATVDNAKMVKTAATVGQFASALTTAAGLSHLWKGATIWGAAEAAAGAVAAATGAGATVMFGKVVSDQKEYISSSEAGVDNRKATEDVNTDTNELYEEELDNYAGNLDSMDEIEINETTSEETQFVDLADTTQVSSETEDETAKTTPSPLDAQESANPFAPQTTDDANDVAEADGDDTNPFAPPKDDDEEV